MANVRRRPTSADVARLARTSRATVSYVLNDKPGQSISSATRARVLQAAQKLGYTPNYQRGLDNEAAWRSSSLIRVSL